MASNRTIRYLFNEMKVPPTHFMVVSVLDEDQQHLSPAGGSLERIVKRIKAIFMGGKVQWKHSYRQSLISMFRYFYCGQTLSTIGIFSKPTTQQLPLVSC